MAISTIPTKNKTRQQRRDEGKIRQLHYNAKLCEREYNLKTDTQARHLARRKSMWDMGKEAMKTAGMTTEKPPQGRVYSHRHAQAPGGLRVEEMIFGVQMASISCTDDTDDRLRDASPNCMIAMEKIIGKTLMTTTTTTNATATKKQDDANTEDDNENENEHENETACGCSSSDFSVLDCKMICQQPLSQILRERFHLTLDCFMDYSGFVKGRCIDTQGFIASNDDMIVLSYRFTTSTMDWIANLSMTSSEWEPNDDADLGHAGFFSSFRGWYTKYCTTKEAKPRVHTAYYNNFIYTIKDIRKYIIDPLTKNWEETKKNPKIKPKKIYVVGCSLGAAVSQIAYCFILEALYPYLIQPDYPLVERLISVTVGSPRVGDKKFTKYINGMVRALRPLDRAVIARLVHHNDIVPHAPPTILTFRHLDKMVYITKDGKDVMINPKMSKQFKGLHELGTIYATVLGTKAKEFEEKQKQKQRGLSQQSLRYSGGRYSQYTAQSQQSRQSSLGTSTDPTRLAISVDLKAAFEEECANAMDGVKDHMQYFYLTYLEKLQKEQKLLNNNSNNENQESVSSTPQGITTDNTNNNDTNEWPSSILNTAASSSASARNGDGDDDDGKQQKDSSSSSP